MVKLLGALINNLSKDQIDEQYLSNLLTSTCKEGIHP